MALTEKKKQKTKRLGELGIEPRTKVLETSVIPFHHSPGLKPHCQQTPTVDMPQPHSSVPIARASGGSTREVTARSGIANRGPKVLLQTAAH